MSLERPVKPHFILMRKRITVILLLCVLSTACQFDDICRIKIDGGDEVIFVFSGSGSLAQFTVRDMGNNRHPKYDDVVWQITPKEGRFEGRWVFDIGSIKYGVVPEGYKQVLPSDEKSPKKLRDGQYIAMPETVSAGYRPVFFKIKDGKVLPAQSQKE